MCEVPASLPGDCANLPNHLDEPQVRIGSYRDPIRLRTSQWIIGVFRLESHASNSPRLLSEPEVAIRASGDPLRISTYLVRDGIGSKLALKGQLADAAPFSRDGKPEIAIRASRDAVGFGHTALGTLPIGILDGVLGDLPL